MTVSSFGLLSGLVLPETANGGFSAGVLAVEGEKPGGANTSGTEPGEGGGQGQGTGGGTVDEGQPKPSEPK